MTEPSKGFSGSRGSPERPESLESLESPESLERLESQACRQTRRGSAGAGGLGLRPPIWCRRGFRRGDRRWFHERVRRSSGFSLIEVLVAMFILTVGAGSLLALFAAAASTHRRAADRTNAALVGERVLSEVRALYSPGKEPEEILQDLRASLSEEIGGYRYEVQLFHPQGDEWTDDELFARVTVRWQDTGSERAESFQMVLLPVYRPGEAEDDRGPAGSGRLRR